MHFMSKKINLDFVCLQLGGAVVIAMLGPESTVRTRTVSPMEVSFMVRISRPIFYLDPPYTFAERSMEKGLPLEDESESISLSTFKMGEKSAGSIECEVAGCMKERICKS